MKIGNRVGVLPRNWERAFPWMQGLRGYDGEARYVAFYWTPVGDEALYDDGQVSGDGNWRLFVSLRHQHPELDQHYNLGYSEVEAEDWLPLDRETRDLVVLPKTEVQARLRQQWPVSGVGAELTTLDWAVIQNAVRQALDNVEVAMEQIQPCDTCFYSIAPGWLRAGGGGFDPCPVCNGLVSTCLGRDGGCSVSGSRDSVSSGVMSEEADGRV